MPLTKNVTPSFNSARLALARPGSDPAHAAPKYAAASQPRNCGRPKPSRFNKGASCRRPGSSPPNFVTVVEPGIYDQHRVLFIVELSTFVLLCKTVVDFLGTGIPFILSGFSYIHSFDQSPRLDYLLYIHRILVNRSEILPTNPIPCLPKTSSCSPTFSLSRLAWPPQPLPLHVLATTSASSTAMDQP